MVEEDADDEAARWAGDDARRKTSADAERGEMGDMRI